MKSLNYIFFITFLFLWIGNHPSDGGSVSEFTPEFAKPLDNLTIPVGRDATFTCVVKGLGGYRVGWVRADSKAIQAIHTHVITHNPRVSVSHSDHATWHLHIKGVREEDRGSFMCQVNTDPMISQVSYLEVVIPPDFIGEETSGDVMAPEGSSVKLTCNAKGHPLPSIVWKRENNQNITLKTSTGAKNTLPVYEGNVLRLQKVSRADMGPYFCIASNGVPPSISKRIIVSVHFHPVIHVPNQLVGAPINTDVVLDCNVEAYPRSIHFWTKDNTMIINGERYEVREVSKSMFEVKMILIIKSFQSQDGGKYSCVAKNSIGDVESIIKLHELRSVGDDVVLSGSNLGERVIDDYDDETNFIVHQPPKIIHSNMDSSGLNNTNQLNKNYIPKSNTKNPMNENQHSNPFTTKIIFRSSPENKIIQNNENNYANTFKIKNTLLLKLFSSHFLFQKVLCYNS